MNFQEILAPLRLAWAERSAREQLMLAGLGIFLALIASWYLILSPTLTWKAEAEAAHAREVERYETFLLRLERYQSLSATTSEQTQFAPLRTIIGRTSSERGLAISRVQPLEDGRLGVWLDTAQSDTLMGWLEQLSREEGVRLDRVSLEREGDGVVRAQLLLAGSGS